MSETSKPAVAAASPYGVPRTKVPAFARFKGTSAWKKYPVRARAYDAFRAAQRSAAKRAMAGHDPAAH